MKTVIKKTGVVFLACFGLLLLNVEVKAQSQKDQKMEKSEKNVTALQLKVEGMHCQAGCANGIDKMLSQQEGILESKTTFDSSASVIEYDQRKISENKIIDLIEEKGFKVEAKKEE